MFSDFLRHLLPSRPSSPTYAPLRAPQNREDDEKQDGDVPSQGTSSSARVTQYVHMVAGSLVGVFLTLLVLWAVDIQYIRVYRPTVKEFAPTMPLKTVVFDEHRELYGRPSAETNAAWDALMPLGSSHSRNGWVLIPNPEEYNLRPGVLVPELGVERFSVAMYHQLHCLRIIRDYYWDLIQTVETGSQDEARKEAVKQLQYEHPQHCFSYLVQAVQCNADLTMEWAILEKDGSRFQVDGVGVPHFQCKDPNKVKSWIETVHSPPDPNKTHHHE